MDHQRGAFGFDGPVRQVVNRVCLKCGSHWYGEECQVKQYTRKEWDAMMNEAALCP